MSSLNNVRAHFSITFIFLLVLLTGCAGTPKKYELLQEPYLREGGGTLLVVDVCVFQDAVGDADDYHMVTESKEGARGIVEVASRYLSEKNVTVKSSLVPYSCGVIGPDGNLPQLVRLNLNSPAVMERRPFAPSEELVKDQALLEALNVLGTASYERALINGVSLLSQGRSQPQPPLKSHTSQELLAASALVQTKLNVSSMIYLGVNGYSQSTGKAVALGTGRFFVALVTGVATGFAVLPGGTTDGSLMTVASIDLVSGEIRRTSAMRGTGDPKKANVVSDKRFIDALLHGLVHREVPSASDTKVAAEK